jgi:Ca2+-binding EF-hand superfamily protein
LCPNQVWFRCFGANKSIPKELHDDATAHQRMHLNFKQMLLGLKKARQYLLTDSAEHSFALAFELVDTDGNQVLDYGEILRWFQSWILYDLWTVGEDPGAVLEFFFK